MNDHEKLLEKRFRDEIMLSIDWTIFEDRCPRTAELVIEVIRNLDDEFIHVSLLDND